MGRVTDRYYCTICECPHEAGMGYCHAEQEYFAPTGVGGVGMVKDEYESWVQCFAWAEQEKVEWLLNAAAFVEKQLEACIGDKHG